MTVSLFKIYLLKNVSGSPLQHFLKNIFFLINKRVLFAKFSNKVLVLYKPYLMNYFFAERIAEVHLNSGPVEIFLFINLCPF